MQDLNVLLEPLRAVLQQIGAFLPRLLVAIGVLVAGWLIAKAARFAVVKAMRAFNFHVLTERAGIDGFLQQGGTEKDTTDLFGAIVYWLVILAALIVAFNGLGLTQVTDLLDPRAAVPAQGDGGAGAADLWRLLRPLRRPGRHDRICRSVEISDADLLGHGCAIRDRCVRRPAGRLDHLDIGGGLSSRRS